MRRGYKKKGDIHASRETRPLCYDDGDATRAGLCAKEHDASTTCLLPQHSCHTQIATLHQAPQQMLAPGRTTGICRLMRTSHSHPMIKLRGVGFGLRLGLGFGIEQGGFVVVRSQVLMNIDA